MAKKLRQIYMDYSATTPVDPRVSKIMRKYESVNFGNPSSIHSLGVSAKCAVEDVRKKVANILNCQPSEIIFTSGGTEGDNLAIFGIAKSISSRPKSPLRGHIITSAIEHQAVLAPCKALEKEAKPDNYGRPTPEEFGGFEVTYLSVSQDGFVNPEDVKKALRSDTFLVSIMYANNEIGTIQPIAEIAKVIRRFRSNSTNYPLFHIDACQAPGALSLNTAKLGVDMMTLSGSKMYGPKGAGCLYVKNGVGLSPLIYGGGQERGLRSGTENVSGIVGFAEALTLADSDREKESIRLTKLRNYFAESILKIIPDAQINGHLETRSSGGMDNRRLPNNLNVYIPNIDNEQLVIELDTIGVAISSGSACNSNEATASHVILALGYDVERSRGSVRFSLGKDTTKKDIDYILKSLPEIMGRIKGHELRIMK